MRAAETVLVGCTAHARIGPWATAAAAAALLAVCSLHAVDAAAWLRGGGDACASRAGAGPAAHLAEGLAAAHALLLARALADGFGRVNAALRRALLHYPVCPWLAALFDDMPYDVKDDALCQFEHESVSGIPVRRNCWADDAENSTEPKPRRALEDGGEVRALRECHFLLCEVAAEVGQRHRWLAYLLLAAAAASLARGAAALVMAFAVDDFSKDWSLALLVAWSVWDGARLLALVVASDAALQEVEAAPELVHCLQLQLRGPRALPRLREVAAFEEQLRAATAALKDCGLFAVDPPLLLAVCGAVGTVIVILLQFQ